MSTTNNQGGLPLYDRESLMHKLAEDGYAVVPNILTSEECDEYVNQYKGWLNKFEPGNSPAQWNSLMQQYRLSHADATWRVRLKSKPVFAQIWNTDKLLCSMDGMAIGEPPELGNCPFNVPGSNWFHFDQGSWRYGLHVYQGAVYLEESTDQDFCFRAFPGSLKHHKEFLDTFEDAAKESAGEDFYRLKKEYVDWFRQKGVSEKKIPVPKGGLVLWDSRTIHDNVKPEKGRTNSDRWRFVVFVSMAPAIWARKKDLQLKKEAYNKMVATAHWPAQGVWLFPSTAECSKTKDLPQLNIIDDHTDIGKSKEVKLLVGLEDYNFSDGEPNDPGWQPLWSPDARDVIKSSDTFA